MSLTGIIKKTLKVGVLGVGFCTIPFGFNMYTHYNVEYEFKGTKVKHKVDGVFSHTTFTEKEDGSIDIDRYGFFSAKFYTDKNKDGFVDWVFIPRSLFARNSYTVSLDRKEDFDKYQSVFFEADADFQEQLERFGIK